jgi:hypothetical protein
MRDAAMARLAGLGLLGVGKKQEGRQTLDAEQETQR